MLKKKRCISAQVVGYGTGFLGKAKMPAGKAGGPAVNCMGSTVGNVMGPLGNDIELAGNIVEPVENSENPDQVFSGGGLIPSSGSIAKKSTNRSLEVM